MTCILHMAYYRNWKSTGDQRTVQDQESHILMQDKEPIKQTHIPEVVHTCIQMIILAHTNDHTRSYKWSYSLIISKIYKHYQSSKWSMLEPPTYSTQTRNLNSDSHKWRLIPSIHPCIWNRIYSREAFMGEGDYFRGCSSWNPSHEERYFVFGFTSVIPLYTRSIGLPDIQWHRHLGLYTHPEPPSRIDASQQRWSRSRAAGAAAAASINIFGTISIIHMAF